MEEANERDAQRTNQLEQMEQRCKALTSNVAEAEGVVNRLALKLRDAEEEIARL